MYHHRKVERKVKGGLNETKNSIKGTLKLFRSNKEPHRTDTFEIHSLYSSAALKKVKKRGGERRREGGERRHCFKTG